jgi:UDP-2,4-diacetamido-2,4,6-trideoxy-beta-L-altropyranose hydrolase
MKILIRTDGSPDLGNGHIIRMKALAKELFQRKIPFLFLIKQDDFWINNLLSENYNVLKLNKLKNNLIEILNDNKITHFIYDTRNDLNQSDFIKIKKLFSNLKIIVNDSPEDIRKNCDLFISPPIDQIKEWDWKGFKGKIYSDWDYVLLREEFKQLSDNKVKSNKILLSFGSTDPFFISEKILKLINKNHIKLKYFDFILLVGPQFLRVKEIKKTFDLPKLNVKIIQSPKNIASLFKSISFAIISFGVTAYELASLKIPFLSIAISEDHEKSSRLFVRNKLSKSLGIVDKLEGNFMSIIDQFIIELDDHKLSCNNFKKNISKDSKRNKEYQRDAF